jgi:hypothetical protein
MSDNQIAELKQQMDDLKAANDALAEKNRELLGETKKAKARAKAAEVDPEEHAELKHQLEALQSDYSKLQKKAQTDMEKLTQQLSQKDDTLRGVLVDNGLQSAMAEVNVKPELRPAVLALLKGQAQLKEADGGSYEALMGDKPLVEGVKEWAASDAGKAFVAAPDNSGGGAAGGSNGLPAAQAGQNTQMGSLSGSKAERVQAIATRFPQLAEG